MKIDTEKFRVQSGDKVSLKKHPTLVDPFYASKDEYLQLLDDHIQKLSALQGLLYAHNRYALLLIFQAMDAAGKDGAIKHVMSGINPQGCQVHSFKHPSAEELDHDFLWRAICRLPERGRIGIFNRSYYEEVLIARVHPEIIKGENLPEEVLKDGLWRNRYQSIVNLEEHLHINGTRVIKFFLHISKEEQRKRFLQRIENPDKNWKLSQDDIEERKRWKDYMDAYEKCLEATSSKRAPWYIVPADDKKNARLIVSQVILNVLKDLKMSYPEPTEAHRKELLAIKEQLEDAKDG